MSKVAIFVASLLLVGLVFYLFSTKGGNRNTQSNGQDACRFSYLPLGDSYTIGESVSEFERWPNQLSKVYQPDNCRLDILANPARTGYTSQDLIDRELPLVSEYSPDFVTIQIGVNDYVQGVSVSTFEANLRYIVQETQANVGQSQNLLLVTIPDFGKTPTGATFGAQDQLSQGVQSFNDVIKDIGMEYGVAVADIFVSSQKVSSNPELVARDGLHPSAQQYVNWTQIIKTTLSTNKIPSNLSNLQ